MHKRRSHLSLLLVWLLQLLFLSPIGAYFMQLPMHSKAYQLCAMHGPGCMWPHMLAKGVGRQSVLH